MVWHRPLRERTAEGEMPVRKKMCQVHLLIRSREKRPGAGEVRAEPLHKGENIGILDPLIDYHKPMAEFITKMTTKHEISVNDRQGPARKACRAFQVRIFMEAQHMFI